MSDPSQDKPKPRRRVRLVGEEEVRVRPPSGAGDDAQPQQDPHEENPYWLVDEAEHPNPALGCIRRGLCCKSNPGSFAPGEVEAAAALLNMSPDDFVKRYLVIDWTELDSARVEMFAPVKVGRDGQPAYETGRRADRLYRYLRGQCVFYDGQGCGIYAARPLECRRYICTNTPADNLSPLTLARMWRDGVAEADARREEDTGE
jgi:Fe-S-cluster containining protein